MCLYTDSNLPIKRRFSYFQLHINAQDKVWLAMFVFEVSKSLFHMNTTVLDQTREQYKASPLNETHSTARELTPIIQFLL